MRVNLTLNRPNEIGLLIYASRCVADFIERGHSDCVYTRPKMKVWVKRNKLGNISAQAHRL
jgi:hypothetical protein